ncbi:MAG: ABC transporter ATP-binding protein/permease [Christensenellaceae bacterium]|jgi:ATP-binding cassette subfamily B protein|nr:ABC transporter ATP-binding protein/permease [Christensenellaceae bacterium]
MFKRLVSLVGRYKVPTILAPLAIIVEVVLEVSIPLAVKNIMDKGIVGGDKNAIYINGMLAIAMAIVSLFAGAVAGISSAKAGTGFACNLRNSLFNKVQDFSFRNVEKYSSGSLITRMTTDVSNIQMSFMMVIRVAVRAPIMFIAALALSININLKMAMIFLAAIPVVLIAIVILGSFALPLFEKLFKMFDKMNTKTQENLVAIRTIKSFVRESHETEEFRKTSANILNAHKKAEKIFIIAIPLMQLVMYAVLVCVLYFGGRLMIAGSLTEGDLLTFTQYMGMILISLVMMAMILVTLFMSRASMRRIIEILKEKPDISDDNVDQIFSVEEGSIEFVDVSFSYGKISDNLVIEKMNFKIESGQTIGIIGGTGSAKSTIVQLMPRLYDATSGVVKAGNRDVREYKIKDLRSAIAMVPQKNILFSGTIKENLLWGNPDATDEQITEAAKNAQAHDFIMSFPEGYDTHLEEGGVNVSGGQKQRLCIARALLKNPKIIIFDDSTSAVDTATDTQIRQSIKSNLSDLTVIIIAQRIASVMDADKIFVLADGKIDGEGSHNELLENNEIYRDVYYSQKQI